jgi:hypothetical protein
VILSLAPSTPEDDKKEAEIDVDTPSPAVAAADVLKNDLLSVIARKLAG